MNNPEPKKVEEKVPWFNYPAIEKIKLAPLQIANHINLIDVIQSRRSVRQFKPLSINTISNVLWLSAKVLDVAIHENGYILSQRAAPSAGARHPIDILISLPNGSEDRLIHYYNPFEHSLYKLNLDNSQVQAFIQHVNSNLESNSATIVWFIAHPERTQSKYTNADSLIWRDAGALIHSFQLACIANEVNSCPLGTLGEPYISELFKNYGNVFGVGGILIG